MRIKYSISDRVLIILSVMIICTCSSNKSNKSIEHYYSSYFISQDGKTKEYIYHPSYSEDINKYSYFSGSYDNSKIIFYKYFWPLSASRESEEYIYIMNPDLSPERSLNIEGLGFVAWLNHSNRLIYNRKNPSDNGYDMYIENHDGTGTTKIADNVYDEGVFSHFSDDYYLKYNYVSADDSKILFKRFNHTTGELSYYDYYVVSADGAGEKKLTSRSYTDGLWVPDGKYIILIGADDGSKSCIYNIETDSFTIVPQDLDLIPVYAFSPDLKKLATQDCILNIDTGSIIEIDFTEPVKYYNSEIQWSPDGTKIIVQDFDYPLYIIDAADGSTVFNIEYPGTGHQLSQDGDYLIYYDSWNDYLYSIRSDGTGRVKISDYGYACFWYNNKIIYKEPDGFYRVNPDGSGKVKLAETDDRVQWGYEIKASGASLKLAYFNEPDRTIKLVDLITGKVSKITHTVGCYADVKYEWLPAGDYIMVIESVDNSD